MRPLNEGDRRGSWLSSKAKIGLAAVAVAVGLTGATVRPSPRESSEPNRPKPATITLNIGNSAEAGGMKRTFIPVVLKNVKEEPVFDFAEFLRTAVETENLGGKVRFLIAPDAEYKIIGTTDPVIRSKSQQYATEDQATYGYDELVLIGLSSIAKLPSGIREPFLTSFKDANNVLRPLGYFGEAETTFNGRKIRALVWAPPPSKTGETHLQTITSFINSDVAWLAERMLGNSLATTSVFGDRVIDSRDDMTPDEVTRFKFTDDIFVSLPKLTNK